MSLGIDHFWKASRQDAGREDEDVFPGLHQTGLLVASQLEQVSRARERSQAVGTEGVPYLVPKSLVIMWWFGSRGL